ncbi:MAG UNVERIFIED_CONTAM: hypothetical protein LVT10_09490 [Anaerolineae bacterium]
MVEALIETVTRNYDLVARHYHLKRVLLGYDELFDYDRYAPLTLQADAPLLSTHGNKRVKL